MMSAARAPLIHSLRCCLRYSTHSTARHGVKVCNQQIFCESLRRLKDLSIGIDDSRTIRKTPDPQYGPRHQHGLPKRCSLSPERCQHSWRQRRRPPSPAGRPLFVGTNSAVAPWEAMILAGSR